MNKLKKLLALALVVCMVCAVSTTAWAEDEPKPFPTGDKFVTDEQLDAGAAEIERLYQIGLQTAKSTRNSSELYMELIDQHDSEWDTEFLPCKHSGHTYGKIGCAMCSYAMVANYYLANQSHNYTPVEIAEAYGTSSCNANAVTLLQAYGLTATAGSATQSKFSETKTKIKGAILDGSPVIVRLVRSSGGYHFVVANGYNTNPDGTIDIYILDSESLISYTSLDEYSSIRGWYPDKYIVVAG